MNISNNAALDANDQVKRREFNQKIHKQILTTVKIAFRANKAFDDFMDYQMSQLLNQFKGQLLN